MNRWHGPDNHSNRWTTEGSAPRGGDPIRRGEQGGSGAREARGEGEQERWRAHDRDDGPRADDLERDPETEERSDVSFEDDYERDGDLVRADYYREDYLYDDPRGRFDEHGRDLAPRGEAHVAAERAHQNPDLRRRPRAEERPVGRVGMGLRERIAALFGASELPRDRGGEEALSSAAVVGWARGRPEGDDAERQGFWARARGAVHGLEGDRDDAGRPGFARRGPPDVAPRASERGWAPPPRHVPHRRESRLWSRVQGVFHGVGPKNYVRPDARVLEDVCERLAYHPYVNARDVEVYVHDGEVTLMGTIDDQEAKRLAEDVVFDVAGVKDVHNEIRVRW